MRITLFLLALCLASGAFAETSQNARKELSGTLSAIKQSDERQKELARKTGQLQAGLKKLQEEMVTVAKNAQRQEEELSAYEDKLAILEDQKKEKTQALQARQGELSSMIGAMVKLKELPPEAVVAMPGKLDETLSTARALGIVTRAIDEEAQSLKRQLRELDALEDKIRLSREAIATRRTELTAHRTELAAQMKERGALVETLGGQEREERQRIQTLTAQSKNLQALVDSLQKSEYGWTERHKTDDTPRQRDAPPGHVRSFEAARGSIRIPAAGKIVSRFGDTGNSAAFSKGIVIETRSSADVVAPFDGEVVFAGSFRAYGRMVIIRHSGDYHTLLSGMEQIDCKPGQHLLEGEPLGSMGADGGKLYMELREDGKPIDPSQWVKG